MSVGLGTNVCLTVFLFDGLFIHPFECNYSFVCSVCVRHVSVRPPLCMFLCDIVHHSVGLYVFFLFVCPSARSSVLSCSVSMNACM